MEIYNITVGADPELFIIDERTDQVVSAVGMIPGEKGNPWRSKDMRKGFGLETDNILAEFNIPPVKSKTNFVNNIIYMQDYIRKFVKNINSNYNIKCVASQIVPESELQSDQAKEFGCSVDYNVYTQRANPKPKGTETNIRSAGFHIHLGYENPDIDTSLALVKYMDAYIGIPSVIIDTDIKRRSLYGKAGCFRLCNYGVEYRTLSSAMMNSVENLEFVWDQLMCAIAACKLEIPLPSKNDIQNAINKSDVDLAQDLIEEFNLIKR